MSNASEAPKRIWDKFISKGVRCETCVWWLRDTSRGGAIGVCRRYRPSGLFERSAFYKCDEYSLTLPNLEESP